MCVTNSGNQTVMEHSVKYSEVYAQLTTYLKNMSPRSTEFLISVKQNTQVYNGCVKNCSIDSDTPIPMCFHGLAVKYYIYGTLGSVSENRCIIHVGLYIYSSS